MDNKIFRLISRKNENKKYLEDIKSLEKQKKTLKMKIGVIEDFFAKKDVKGSANILISYS